MSDSGAKVLRYLREVGECGSLSEDELVLEEHLGAFFMESLAGEKDV
jgi:hypothetical protein